jgi:prolyl 4-hydroxylase
VTCQVAAVKGRLLVFSNVIHGTNVRHPLAEHAGTPVLDGEKSAFNLWFRQL